MFSYRNKYMSFMVGLSHYRSLITMGSFLYTVQCISFLCKHCLVSSAVCWEDRSLCCLNILVKIPTGHNCKGIFGSLHFTPLVYLPVPPHLTCCSFGVSSKAGKWEPSNFALLKVILIILCLLSFQMNFSGLFFTLKSCIHLEFILSVWLDSCFNRN